MAAFAGHLEVVRLLLQARADKEKVMTDARQATPLELAARNEHVEPWAAQKKATCLFFLRKCGFSPFHLFSSLVQWPKPRKYHVGGSNWVGPFHHLSNFKFQKLFEITNIYHQNTKQTNKKDQKSIPFLSSSHPSYPKKLTEVGDSPTKLRTWRASSKPPSPRHRLRRWHRRFTGRGVGAAWRDGHRSFHEIFPFSFRFHLRRFLNIRVSRMVKMGKLELTIDWNESHWTFGCEMHLLPLDLDAKMSIRWRTIPKGTTCDAKVHRFSNGLWWVDSDSSGSWSWRGKRGWRKKNVFPSWTLGDFTQSLILVY